jgi:hypothetical protein
MTDELDPLVSALAGVGMDSGSCRALLVLPLVEIAWADGAVQPREHDLLLRAAEERFGVGADGALLVADWLRHRPSAAYHDRGRQLLRTLAGVGTPGFDEAALRSVEAAALEVARSAGGFLGWFGRVARSESEVLEKLRRDLAAAATPPAALAPADREAARAHYTTTLSTQSLAGLTARGVVSVDGRSVPVTREGVTMGSAADCAIVVAGAEPVHCRLFERQRKFYVEDRSKGGTWLDGERVGERRLLGGERLGCGAPTGPGATFKMMRKGRREAAD